MLNELLAEHENLDYESVVGGGGGGGGLLILSLIR